MSDKIIPFPGVTTVEKLTPTDIVNGVLAYVDELSDILVIATTHDKSRIVWSNLEAKSKVSYLASSFQHDLLSGVYDDSVD